MIELVDIKNYMINKIHNNKFPISDGYYDDDGYCGKELRLSILSFWEKFNTNNDFKELISCEWCDDIDLNGGRDYYLSDDKFIDMVFDYMYNTLDISLDEYSDMIYNTIDFSDELEGRYSALGVKRDPNIVKNIWDKFDFLEEDIIPHVIKYDSRDVPDKYETLEYIGQSKIDDKPIYKIKSLGVRIPKGYKIIKTLNEINGI